MTEHHSGTIFRAIFILAALLLLGVGVQSAAGCLLPENQTFGAEIKVDRCHLASDKQKTTPCCQIEVCHHTAPQQRDLDAPEYRQQFKDSHSLAQESHLLTPQLKTGKPFITQHLELPQFAALTKTSTPRQSLHSLRTIVLLN